MERSSPPALTPDVTGSGDSSLLAAEASRSAARRPVALYPNLNPRNRPVNPFSRSAAKRQSVMTLGSIEHLQHYFTKTGLAAASPRKHFVPALGVETTAESLSSVPELDLPSPPPSIPEIRHPPIDTPPTDPRVLLPDVVDDILAVLRLWAIQGDPGTASDDPVDVLRVLKTTTRMVRSVRNYALVLPDPSADVYPRKIASHSNALPLIRRSALEVLAALRDLEERSRIAPTDDAYDTQSEHGSSLGPTVCSRGPSPSIISDDDTALDPDMSISFIRVQGRGQSVPVWEADDVHSHTSDDAEHPRWDEKLLLGNGWLYKQDVRLADMAGERSVVQRYVDLVDDVVFGGSKDGKRGWQLACERAARTTRGKQARRVSAGDVESFRFPAERPEVARRVSSSGLLESMQSTRLSEEPEESEDDDDLPEWAKRSCFANKAIERAHSLIRDLLPEDLQTVLPPPSDKAAFLRALSSGQLLCVALNAGIRRSRKTWEQIRADRIHDVVALERSSDAGNKARSTWAFRRIENLGLWVSALKGRYHLPIVTPVPSEPPPVFVGPPLNSSPARKPSTPRPRSSMGETPLHFDASLVARRGEGWEGMLEAVLLRWVAAVVDEKRREQWS